MCCKSFWKRIVSFILAVGLGLLAEDILQKESPAENNQENFFVKVVYSEKGTGISGRSDKGLPPFYIQKSPETSNSKTSVLKVLSKPCPTYTDAARQNQIEGKVRLRVTFLASGQIGHIVPINNLSDGLTEQAIAAAKEIKFDPATRNGVPISITKIIEYNFTIY